MPWHGFGSTDIGRVRMTNQDAYKVNNDLGLWIVADGMGSHKHSGIASQTAIETINTFLERHHDSEAIGQGQDCRTLLHKAVLHANEAIYTRGQDQPELDGMGTTVVLAFIPKLNSNEVFVAHAGDSRAYLFRDSTMTSLTRDHTLLEERIRDGLLPKDTPADHKLGHVLTKVLGIDSTIDPDCSPITLQSYDQILLCSDGLIKMLNDEEILNVLMESRKGPSEESCQRLIREANGRGGHDNVTVVLIEDKRYTGRNGE